MRRRLPITVLLLGALTALAWFLLRDEETRQVPSNAENERDDAADPSLIGRAPNVVPVPPSSSEGGEEHASSVGEESAGVREQNAGAILSRFGGMVSGSTIEGVVLRGLKPVGEGTACLFRAQREGGASP